MVENIKKCPFCGSAVTFMTIITGMKMFYCKNYRECGAVVSFDNPRCNLSDRAKIEAWNRRVTDGGHECRFPKADRETEDK